MHTNLSPIKFYSFRHKLNLEHNLLELPDVYWDREELEPLFTKTTKYQCCFFIYIPYYVFKTSFNTPILYIYKLYYFLDF